MIWLWSNVARNNYIYTNWQLHSYKITTLFSNICMLIANLLINNLHGIFGIIKLKLVMSIMKAILRMPFIIMNYDV